MPCHAERISQQIANRKSCKEAIASLTAATRRSNSTSFSDQHHRKKCVCHSLSFPLCFFLFPLTARSCHGGARVDACSPCYFPAGKRSFVVCTTSHVAFLSTFTVKLCYQAKQYANRAVLYSPLTAVATWKAVWSQRASLCGQKTVSTISLPIVKFSRTQCKLMWSLFILTLRSRERTAREWSIALHHRSVTLGRPLMISVKFS